MKKYLLVTLACLTAFGASALPKALYVKNGDKVTKYNFGVAEDLRFTNGGHTLTITGYNEVINLDEIDYITFTAPADNTAMLPSAQKEKLVEVGEKVNSLVNVNDYADIIRMQDEFFRGYYDAGGNWVTPPCDFTVPSELYDVHATTESLVNSLREMTKGNVASVRALKAASVKLYKFADYAGIYAPDYTTQTWTKTGDADYFEFRFNSKTTGTYSVRVEASKDFISWDKMDTVTVEVPKTLTVTFAKDNAKLASAVLKSDFADGQKLSLVLDVVANNLTAHNTFDVVDNLITDVVEVKVNGTQLVKSVSNIDGKNLVSYDALRQDVEDAIHLHDQEGNCIDGDPSALIAHFIRANSETDIVGQLQIHGKTFGFDKLYDTMKDDTYNGGYVKIGDYAVRGSYIHSHNSDYSKIYKTEDILSVVEDHVKQLNNYADVSFSYDGNGVAQGFCAWDTNVEYEGYSFNTGTPDENDSYWEALVDGKIVQVEREYNDSTYTPTGKWFYLRWKYEPGCYYYDWEAGEKVYVSEDDLLKNYATEYVYYDAQPVLVFPDLSTFSFEEYFDSTSFRKLIDDYDEIINTYDSITGQDTAQNNPGENI